MTEKLETSPIKKSAACSSHVTEGEPRQKSAYAIQYLALLGRDKFEFRCFPDHETLNRRNFPQRMIGSFDDHKGKLRLLNEAGYGIFVQVNASDGAGNKASNITAAPTFFVDLDGTPRENIDRFGLAPHLVLETSHGKFHSYWRVHDIPVNEFKKVQQRLAKLIGSDPAVCDLPRVMRLPGFLHQKVADQPFLARPIHVSDHSPFAFDEFCDSLAEAEATYCTAQHSPSNQPTKTVVQASDDLSRDNAILQHLIEGGNLNLGNYSEWVSLGIALKNSYGEAGFELWHSLSEQASNYEDYNDCRQKWDEIDQLTDEAARSTMATYAKRARDAGWTDFKKRSSHTGWVAVAGGKVDQAVQVLDQANEAGDERFLDLNGKPHVRFRQAAGSPDEHWTNCRVNGELYRGVLRRRFYLDYAKILSPEQLNNAIGLLEAEALEKNERHPVHLRSAMHEGNIYIDLQRADGSGVEVTAEGWDFVRDMPVRFVRGSRGELPVPEHGGSLADFERHMPGLKRADVQCVLAFAIGTFNPQGTYPLLQIVGGQGSGKSIVGDMVVAITDPPVNRGDARFSFAAREQDLLIHAQNARVLYFDNVSSFGPRESDTLCRLLSGAAFSTRQLYTMDEEYRIALRRPVIATSIAMPSIRGDLIDRMLPVSAHRISLRLPEEVVWEAFKLDLPRLFGLVLTGLSAAIRNRTKVQASIACSELKLPRLADFAAFVEAVGEVLELAQGEFCAMLRCEQAGLQAEAAAGDPLGAALVQYFSERDISALNCTAAELLKRLADGTNDRQRGWPSVNKVRGRLERIRPGLHDLGIDVQFTPPEGKRNVWSMQISITDEFCPSQPAGITL